MKKMIMLVIVSNFSTGLFAVHSFAQEAETQEAETTAYVDHVIAPLLTLQDRSGLLVSQDPGNHVLTLRSESNWKTDLKDAEKRKYIYEMADSKTNLKEILQLNLNDDGTIKESVSYIRNMSGHREQYISFHDQHKISNMTTCWNYKFCSTVTKGYCYELLRADNKFEFINKKLSHEMTALETVSGDALFGSTALARANSSMGDAPKRGNVLPRIKAGVKTETYVNEVLKSCHTIDESLKENYPTRTNLKIHEERASH